MNRTAAPDPGCSAPSSHAPAEIRISTTESLFGSHFKQLLQQNRLNSEVFVATNDVRLASDSVAKVRQRRRPAFLASLVRFLNKDAEDLIGRRRSDVDRSKWNCEAIKDRFQMSMRLS